MPSLPSARPAFPASTGILALNIIRILCPFWIPGRNQDLETGLGLATNLLSTRLTELTEAGVIEKSTVGNRSVYQLTELGRHTDRLLWELARFGSQVDPDPDPREPGNMRTLALPLRVILEAVPNRPDLVARLLINDDAFTIISTSTGVEVKYRDTSRGG